MQCKLCPRECLADREAGETGLCGASDKIIISRAAPHYWEEPPISGSHGSGAIFFSGCPMHCVFCQNREISRDCRGKPLSEDQLADIMLRLRESGVHNINLVTPTHYSDRIARVLRKIKPSLGIPVVYNCGGYEKVEALRELEGLVDVYLPDFKYFSPERSAKYSSAPDYAEVASRALTEMFRQTGRIVFDGDRMVRSGLIVRHLVLPGGRHDSIAVLDRIASLLPIDDIRLSLMSQYTPDFAADSGMPELCRHLTAFEYSTVLEHAERLGFDGYMQDHSSATSAFTPNFSKSEFPK